MRSLCSRMVRKGWEPWHEKRRLPPAAAYAVSSAMIAMLSRSSAVHRTRSRVNSATKDSARAKIAHVVAASRARLRRLYHVERLTPSASHCCFAGRRGPMVRGATARKNRREFARRVPGPLLLRAVPPRPTAPMPPARKILNHRISARWREMKAVIPGRPATPRTLMARRRLSASAVRLNSARLA